MPTDNCAILMPMWNSDYYNTIQSLDKNGIWKRTSTEEKVELLNLLSANYIYFNPYKNCFISISTGKSISPELTIDFFNIKNRPEKSSFLIGKEFIYKKLQRDIFLRKIFSNLKYIGFILGIVLFFKNINFGLFLVSLLFYLSYGFETFRNVNIENVESDIKCSIHWRKWKPVYILLSFALLISTITLLYLLVTSFWITIGLFFLHYFLFVQLINNSCSASYAATTGLMELENGLESYEHEFTPPSSRKETSENR